MASKYLFAPSEMATTYLIRLICKMPKSQNDQKKKNALGNELTYSTNVDNGCKRTREMMGDLVDMLSIKRHFLENF